MAEKPKKSTRTRKARNEESELGIHKIPVDIVEIERNIIEKWLLQARHWIKHNSELARKLTLSTLGIFVVILLTVIIHSTITEQHNRQFYDLVSDFETGRGNEEALSGVQSKAEKLCNTFWSTSGSRSACLLNTLLSADKNTSVAAESLEDYTSSLGNNGLGLFFRFYTGYYYESAGNLDEALKQYKKLQEELATIEKEDMAIFHVARIHYYLGNYDKAKTLFGSLVEQYRASSFSEKARQYISLISLQSK